MNKAEKISALNRRVLEDQDVQNLNYDDFKQILGFIDENIIPYIDDNPVHDTFSNIGLYSSSDINDPPTHFNPFSK